MNKTAVYLTIGSLVILGLAIFFSLKSGSTNNSNNQTVINTTNGSTANTITNTPTNMPTINQSQAPAMEIDKNKSYTAILKTSAGDIVIQLFADKTPITVNNFVHLAKTKFYDKTIFHRVIKGFMIQGGDPKGDGTGGPGYKFNDEPFDGEYTRGTIAMANSGPNTNGSQFFIMHQDNPLPKNYVIFGKVTSGMDVVDKIANSPVTQSPMGEMSVPQTPTTINSVDIVEK